MWSKRSFAVHALFRFLAHFICDFFDTKFCDGFHWFHQYTLAIICGKRMNMSLLKSAFLELKLLLLLSALCVLSFFVFYIIYSNGTYELKWTISFSTTFLLKQMEFVNNKEIYFNEMVFVRTSPLRYHNLFKNISRRIEPKIYINC